MGRAGDKEAGLWGGALSSSGRLLSPTTLDPTPVGPRASIHLFLALFYPSSLPWMLLQAPHCFPWYPCNLPLLRRHRLGSKIANAIPSPPASSPSLGFHGTQGDIWTFQHCPRTLQALPSCCVTVFSWSSVRGPPLFPHEDQGPESQRCCVSHLKAHTHP